MSFHPLPQQQTHQEIQSKKAVDYYQEYQAASHSVREETRLITLEVLNALAKINTKFEVVDKRLQSLEERIGRLEKQKCPACKGSTQGSCIGGVCTVCSGSGSLLSNQ